MKSSQRWPDNPFWEFSLDFYSRKGVAERLISLQEELRVDVNLMLYCYWTAYIGAPILSESVIKSKSKLVSEWQDDIVIPIRRIRLKLKNHHIFKKWSLTSEVRSKVKIVELEAERAEQLILYGNYLPIVDPNIGIGEKRKRAVANVALYFRYLEKNPSTNDEIILDQLLELLFEGHS